MTRLPNLEHFDDDMPYTRSTDSNSRYPDIFINKWHGLISPVALRWAREANGFTQREAAQLLGCARETYAFWEVGKHFPSKKFKDNVVLWIQETIHRIKTGQHDPPRRFYELEQEGVFSRERLYKIREREER